MRQAFIKYYVISIEPVTIYEKSKNNKNYRNDKKIKI